MYPLGLHAAGKAAYLDKLVSSHEIRVRASLLTLQEKEISNLSDFVSDGQVNVDVTAAVDRSLTLSLFDPRARLSFDPDSPADSALFLNRMVKVTYGVWVNSSVGWVDLPVFTGPITKLDRPADDVVSVECQGKESIALRPVWHPITLRKGMRKTEAIRTLLRERAGETSFDLPDLNVRLGKTISVGRLASAWKVANKIARSMNRQLYYDGDGVVRLRHPSSHVYTFRPKQSIMSPVQVSYDLDNFANTIYVRGGQPRHAAPATPKEPPTGGDSDSAAAHVPDIRWVATANASHPLSAARLGRIGSAGGFIVETVDNDKIRSRTEARRVARQRLDDRLLGATTVSFEALPLPFLEPADKISVVTDDGTIRSRLDQFSLPLRVGATMSVGYIKKVSATTRRHRR